VGSRALETVFARCFSERENTSLVGGFDEPLYEPASGEGQMHCLRYREDFFASALHEVAHWCIAGPERRLLTDFGYWYAPDGRSESQQRAFENVEYKPQALEWYFSKACQCRFRLSSDNLDGAGGAIPANDSFKQRVVDQAVQWRREGLPARGELFFLALCEEYGTITDFNTLEFSVSELE